MSAPDAISRRDILRTAGWVGGSALLAAGAGAYRFQIGQKVVAQPGQIAEGRALYLEATPRCGDAAETPWVSEGPFYAPSTPLRTDLRPVVHAGRELRLAGRVLDTACRPIAGAVVDFWQTNPDGVYDHFGYDFRGHQFTDADGRYELLTLLPASYVFIGVARRRHIHVKVAAPGRPLLTSQIFFPFGPDRLVEDFSFNPALVSTVLDRPRGFVDARFNFVLEAA